AASAVSSTLSTRTLTSTAIVQEPARGGSLRPHTILNPGCSPSDHVVVPGLAHFASEEAVGLHVVHKTFLHRGPVQLPAQANRDHTQVAQRHRPVADFYIADWRFARADAVEEIAHVIVADREVELLLLEWFLDQVGVARFKFAAGYVDPALGPQ